MHGFIWNSRHHGLRHGVCLLGAVLLAGAALAAPFTVHRGMANASAVVAIGTDRFLAASDEDNSIRLYSSVQATPPLAEFETTPWLELRGKSEEADFEGAARIGDTIYWVGSHGRNKDGKPRPNRHRLLATRVEETADGVRLTPVGRPYRFLLEDIVRAPQFAAFQLAAAAGLSPDDPAGFNIEGLSATPEGGLLVGLRGPVPGGKALLVPVLNPAELPEGRPARLGQPVSLDLGGHGIRDMVWTGREYFILSGKPGSGGKQRLYQWSGGDAAPALVENASFKKVNPEALAVFGPVGEPRLLILSDDGNRKKNDTADPALRQFRSFWVEP